MRTVNSSSRPMSMMIDKVNIPKSGIKALLPAGPVEPAPGPILLRQESVEPNDSSIDNPNADRIIDPAISTMTYTKINANILDTIS